MTKIKKVVAMALAFLMIFSSASVLANAWTVTVDDGFNLAIGTKFFINEGTEDAPSWVETEKVAPGDNVKARVYIGTDYYSNSSTLLFFYDKDFFTHSYAAGQNALSVNSEAGNYTGYLNPAPVLNSQVTAGYIDSAFLDKYAAISVNLLTESGVANAMYDDSTWIFEFDLKVAESATGTGDLFVKDTTVQNSTSQNKALVNVPKGPEGGTNADVWPMWRWNANVTLTSQPVSTLGYVTFNANSGEFADGKAEFVSDGNIKDDVTVPADPTRDGYTFIGWVDAADTTPTYEEAQATVPVAKIPYEPVAYNAYWIKNVNITFDTDGGSEIAARENVTPYTEFAAVAAPTKAGYTFVGWDVRGNMTLPATYPDVDTTYTAIWAKDVVVSFDTNGAAAIESINGVAGEAFEAVIANPSKEGHRFVKWSPALPTVFPEADTTYKAIFETNVYNVYYYVEGKLVTNTQVEYGEAIPTSHGNVVAPAGMTLSAWYTDAAMTKEFVEGTVMGTGSVKLYAKYEYKTYNAIFDANGGKFADGSATVSVPTVYLGKIVVPADPTRAGYEFTGWTPYAGGDFEVANDMTFYATWVEVERNVEYYAEGYGENGLYETFDLKTGEEFEVPAEPYKEGYSFLYWSETEGGAEATLPATMPALEDGVTLKYYAVFEINEYKITWDVDGDKTEKTYEYNSAVENIADPTKEGYVFAGWADKTGAVVTVPANMPANDVALTATWTIESYTFKFDTDGGNAIGDITAEYNESIVVPADPTKEGHTFAGWSETIPSTMPDLGENGATKTFKATWTVNNYTVTWIVDGAEDKVTYAYGAAITEPTPTKAGYVFAGWDAEVPATMPANNLTFTGSWDPATDTKYTVNIHTMGTDGQYEVATEELKGTTNETVNAIYTVEEGFELGANSVTSGKVEADGSLVLDVYLNRKTITISFNSDGGSEVASIEGLYGADITAPADPTKKGYEFKEWENIPATFPAADAEYKAIWSAKSYDATFIVDGEVYDTVETVFNTAIVAPTEPSKKGHQFDGWTPEVGNMTEEGMTFTAVWSKKTFSATFMVDGKVYDTKDVVFGEAITLPEAPTKAGYIFREWLDANGNPIGSMTEEGMTFEAQWNNATDTPYTVTVYTMNTDGETYTAVSTPYGGVTGEEATAEGKYTIGEGFKLSEVKENKLTGEIAADGSLVLEVYLDRLSYEVKTNVDGTVEVVDTVLYGATVAAPAAPSKTGYTFTGWKGYTEGMAMPVGGVEFVAEFAPNTDTAYKVIVNYKDVKNGGVEVSKEITFAGTTENAIVIAEAKGNAENTEYVLYKELLADEDYLKHFYVDEAASTLEGTVAADGSAVLEIKFVPNKYAVTYNANGGAFADGSTTYVTELEYYSVVGDGAPAEEPTKEGNTFAGWKNADQHVTGVRTYAANWSVETYTIILDANGGTVTPESITAEYGATIQPVDDPTKEGHTFAGWSEAIPSTMPDLGADGATKTITASWTVNNYTVTWIVDGAEDKVSYAYGAAITEPTPTKTGYVFAGWDAEVPATMPANDLTFTATWNPATDTKYTVNIHTMGTDGNYEVATEVLEGTTESTVNAVYTVEEGFELGANSVTSGKVAADGSLVLDVYLNRKTITISFNTDGGTAVDAISGLYGAAVGTPATTTKTGYTFVEWENLPTTFPAANTTVKAVWDINYYTITFNAGEGTFAGDLKEITQDFAYNTMPVAPEIPEKVGYTFTAWTPDFALVTGEATYTAQYAAGAVKYIVKTYTMDTEGNYGDPVEEVKGGIADTLATVTPVAKTGFTVAPESVLEKSIAADGSTVLEVYYARNQYDFTVNVDGAVTTTKYYFEAAIAPVEEPTKEGHTFAGWDKEVPATMPAEAYEIKATWTVNNYTVTWIVDGAEDEVTYAYGAAITEPTPVKAGYVFAGWDAEVPATMPANNLVFNGSWDPATDTKYTVNIHTMNADGNYEVATEELEGTTDSTVNAVYTVEEGFELGANSVTSGKVAADGSLVLDVYLNRKSYTITFDTKGGSTINSVTGLYGAPVGTIAEPTKEGHTFAGWATEIPATIPAEDITITANEWIVNSYTLEYRSYNGVYETYEVPFGTAEMPVPVDPTRTGWEFTGWDIDLPATMPAEKVTLVAKWAKESYTITFDTDGGSAINDVTAEYNATINLTAVPTKAGYIFNGWVDAEGNSVELKNITKMPDLGENGAVVTYKATWANDTHTAYTVNIHTMNVDGVYETVTSTKYGETEAEVTADYTVAEGFSLGADSVTSGKVAADGSLVLDVYLVRNMYILTVDIDGNVTTEEVRYGAAINVEDPYKTGYTFTGWTPALPATMPAKDVDVTASWKINSYVITFNAGEGTFAGGLKEITKEFDYNATPAAPEIPEKVGYTFTGWTPDFAPVTGEATYTAQFVAGAVNYTVETYTMDTEGNYGDPVVEVKGGTADTTATVTPVEKTGFTLDAERNVLEGTIAADGSLVLEVYYIRNQYDFKVTVDNDTTTTKYYFEAAIAPVEEPTKEGHTFAGWDKAVPATMPADAYEIKATWTVNNYTVTWIVDGAEDEVTYAYGAAITEPTPTKTGYVFAGWDAEVPATMPANNLVFNGSWDPATDTKYTVNIHTMNAEGNYEVATEELEGTTDSTVNAVYTVEEGFELGANSVTSGKVAADGSLVLDVYLNRKTVTITFDTKGGSTINSVTGLYGAPVGTIAEPTKEGHTFAGWATEIPATIPADNVTISVNDWDVNTYTFTWVVNGETKLIEYYDYGTAITAFAEPSKAGYTFAGWAWTNDNGETVATGTTMPAYNVTATATWTANDGVAYTVEIHKMNLDGETYEVITKNFTDKAGATVTYAPETFEGFTYVAEESTVSGTVAGDGSLVLKAYYSRNAYTLSVTVDGKTTTSTVFYGAPVSVEAPSKEGYDFAGWDNTVPATMPANDVTLVAQWNVQQYTVTFVVEGVEETTTLNYGAAIEATKPVKEGYRFVGWADETGALATVPATMPAKNLKFSAIFETITYSVNYYVNGVLVETLSGEYGEEIATSIPSYKVPTGYAFDGWYTDASCTEDTKLAEGATITTAKTLLFAKTSAKTYNAIFDADGGKFADGSATVTVPTVFDEAIKAPEIAPTKDGFTFAGWTPYVGDMVTEGATFTAIWEVKVYTVTYIAEGSADQVFDLTFGEEIDLPAEPELEGYIFKHWSLTPNGEAATIPANMPAEPLTYYAVFEKVAPSEFTVTWVIDGAETVETLATGAAITAPEATKEGFVFKYWSLTADGEETEVPATMGTENLKFYAVFEEEVAELPIKLMPSEDFTGVIERYGEIESHNDGSADPELEYENEDFEEYYVYGFTGRRFREDDVYDYFYVQGNGYMELEYSELSDDYGTGAKVIVKDNDTDEVVEEFYVIIFGDLDGDAVISNDDAALLNVEVTAPTWSNRRNGIPYMIKAADLDLDGRVNNDDAVLLNYVPPKSMTIDQTTGEAI